MAWANAVAAFLWRELHPAELAVVKKPMDPLWRTGRCEKAYGSTMACLQKKTDGLPTIWYLDSLMIP